MPIPEQSDMQAMPAVRVRVESLIDKETPSMSTTPTRHVVLPTYKAAELLAFRSCLHKPSVTVDNAKVRR